MVNVSVHIEYLPVDEPEEHISVRWNEISLAKPVARETRDNFRVGQRLGLRILDLRKCWSQSGDGRPVWAAVCDTWKGVLRFAIHEDEAPELFHSPFLTYFATTADGPDVAGSTEENPRIIQPVYLKALRIDGGITEDDIHINITDGPSGLTEFDHPKLECR